MGLDARRFGPGRFVWAALLALAGYLVFVLWMMGADLAPAASGLALIALIAQIAWLLGPPPLPKPPLAGRPRYA